MCDILASSLFWCSKINSLQLVLLWMVINIHIKIMACNFVKKARNAFQWFSCNIRIHCHCLITLTKAVFLTWLITCSTNLNIYYVTSKPSWILIHRFKYEFYRMYIIQRSWRSYCTSPYLTLDHITLNPSSYFKRLMLCNL